MKESLANLLANLRDALRAETSNVQPRLISGPGCFSWTRFLNAARNGDWTPAEQEHVDGCAHCKHMAANAVHSLRDLPEPAETPDERVAEQPARSPEAGAGLLPPAATTGP